jgi:hypothetical protein
MRGRNRPSPGKRTWIPLHAARPARLPCERFDVAATSPRRSEMSRPTLGNAPQPKPILQVAHRFPRRLTPADSKPLTKSFHSGLGCDARCPNGLGCGPRCTQEAAGSIGKRQFGGKSRQDLTTPLSEAPLSGTCKRLERPVWSGAREGTFLGGVRGGASPIKVMRHVRIRYSLVLAAGRLLAGVGGLFGCVGGLSGTAVGLGNWGGWRGDGGARLGSDGGGTLGVSSLPPFSGVQISSSAVNRSSNSGSVCCSGCGVTAGAPASHHQTTQINTMLPPMPTADSHRSGRETGSVGRACDLVEPLEYRPRRRAARF